MALGACSRHTPCAVAKTLTRKSKTSRSMAPGRPEVYPTELRHTECACYGRVACFCGFGQGSPNLPLPPQKHAWQSQKTKKAAAYGVGTTTSAAIPAWNRPSGCKT